MASDFQARAKGLVSEEAPVRAPVRPSPREDDPRARAAKRAAEIRGHLGDLDEGTDEFYIDPSCIPSGWTYEWKMRTVLNQENPSYQVHLARMGWEPVPASRHPEMMPAGFTQKTIERKGMVLMERPKEITDEARSIEMRRARQQVKAKEEQLAAAGPGQFERSNKDASLVKVKKSYEPMPVPEE
jgi:hypothetical protein